jgi:hypothetical protein
MKPYRPNPTLVSYYEVPVEIIDSRDILIVWVTRAARSQKTGNHRRSRGE